MSLTTAPTFIAPMITGPLNPIETALAAFNTNPYFIGVTMILLNLGGRFLAMEVSKEQEKFFQTTWVRAILIFVVCFVATRNVSVAFWLSIVAIIVLRYIFNEKSSLYVLKNEGPSQHEEMASGSEATVLTPEEADIYRKLTDKLAKGQAAPAPKNTDRKKYDLHEVYLTNIGHIQGAFT